MFWEATVQVVTVLVHIIIGVVRQQPDNCSALFDKLPELVHYPPRSGEHDPTANYWSAQQNHIRPKCYFRPRTAHDISNILTVLQREFRYFVVKGGGNAPFRSSVAKHYGIIDLLHINKTILSSDRKTIRVGGGSHWEDVYSVLDPLGLAVVGSRAGIDGVGGFTLGGGLSFFSGLHGFACDNVKSFEVVTLRNQVVRVNATNEQELYWALRGSGGPSWGIVSEFELEVFEQGDMWMKSVVYDGKAANRTLVPMMAKLARDGLNEDPAAHAYFVQSYDVPSRRWSFSTNFFHAKPLPGNATPPVFKSFEEPVRELLKNPILTPFAESPRKLLDGTTRKSFNETFRKLSNETIRKPFNETIRKPFNETTHKSLYDIVRRPFNETTRKSFNGTIRKSFNETIRKLFNETIHKPFNQSTCKPANESIPAIIQSTTLVDSLFKISQLHNEPAGRRQTSWTTSVGYTSVQMFYDIGELYTDWVHDVLKHTMMGDIVPSLVYHPITENMLEKMQKNGGNALGLYPGDGGFMMVQVRASWEDKRFDHRIEKSVKKFVKKIQKVAEEQNNFRGFIHMNYAGEHQKVFKSYGKENHKKLKKLAEKRDFNRLRRPKWKYFFQL